MAQKTEHEERFVERLCQIRKHRGISCNALAQQAMTRAALSKIECGERRVSLGEAFMLAGALKVSLEALCGAEAVTVHTSFTTG
jgi:transcriptional regulator with XRE-family HTH domain